MTKGRGERENVLHRIGFCSRCSSFCRESGPSYGSRSHCKKVVFPRPQTTRIRTSSTLAACISEAPRFQPLRASARFWRCHPSSSVALTRMIPLLHRVAIANRTVDAQALASVLLPDKHRPPQWLDPRLSDSRTSNDRKRSNRTLLRHATSRVSSGPRYSKSPNQRSGQRIRHTNMVDAAPRRVTGSSSSGDRA